MKNEWLFLGTTVAFLWTAPPMDAQQQDVPEPVFLNFSIQPPYIPTYHGRDPFKPLNWIVNRPRISLVELEYHGVVTVDGATLALFGWRVDQTKEYTLKNRKLYSDEGIPVDGVVGEITDTQVILIQDDQKIVYPRQ